MLASLKDAGLCAVFAAVGLTVNLTWCTVAGHTPGFTDALASLGIPVNPRAFFLAGILAMSLLGVALYELCNVLETRSCRWRNSHMAGKR